ncbi:MAG: DUF1918 domain-containing protein [Actinomycetota bacterium]
MTGRQGDRIIVESEQVGTPTREGEILEVIEGQVGLRYRVRWTDDHETVFTPSGGSARIVAGKRKASRRKAKK